MDVLRHSRAGECQSLVVSAYLYRPDLDVCVWLASFSAADFDC
ncbi:Uncharacterised protein [Vibrio cholerae]|nr:Uncharacterised protein [Vibrio cholerae]